MVRRVPTWWIKCAREVSGDFLGHEFKSPRTRTDIEQYTSTSQAALINCRDPKLASVLVVGSYDTPLPRHLSEMLKPISPCYNIYLVIYISQF